MKTSYIFLIFIALNLAVGCETTEKIDEFPLRPSQLVANCFFAEDSMWVVQVSKSLSVLDNAELKLVDDATVFLYRNSELIDSIKSDPRDGLYRTYKSLPKKGNNYTLEVVSPDFKRTLFGEDYLPENPNITDVSVIILDSSFYQDYYLEAPRGNVRGNFDISIQDPGEADNYYQLSVYGYYYYFDFYDSTEYREKRTINFSTDDPIADENDSYMRKIMFTDEFFNGQQYKLRLDFEDWDATYGSVYEIELISLTRANYLYRKTVKDYQNASGDPFSEPVRIFSNIENGYGIFAGYSTTRHEFPLFD